MTKKNELELDRISKFTDKPWNLAREHRDPVYSVGATPEKAVRTLGRAVGWGRVENFHPLECEPGSRFTWGLRFTARGTSMKAGGWEVPGGYLLTWWK